MTGDLSVEAGGLISVDGKGYGLAHLQVAERPLRIGRVEDHAVVVAGALGLDDRQV